MLYTDVSMLVGMTYVYLPFMILPLYAVLVKMDMRLLEAAHDLGASRFKAFWLITVPLSKGGIVAGCMLVFIPAVGEFVIPSLLGGADNIMIGRVMWDELFSSNNWPRASALSVVMMVVILVPLALYYRTKDRTAHTARLWLAAVFLFLYIPLLFLVVFSFNSTRQDGVFTGFSLRWYQALLTDSRLVEGFWLSLKVALLTGTLSVVLGCFAAFVLVRYRKFSGRTLFYGMVNAPLVMPEVIIGLSLLLLMVASQRMFGFPERGFATLVLGHTLLGMAYAVTVIQS
eukprot:gene52538-70243_t